MHGSQVLAYDVAPQALSTAAAQIRTDAEQLVSEKRLSADEAQAALTRIRFTTDPAEAVRADVLSESVPEDPDLKARVFAQFHPLCPPHTIFTTDTSTLVPSMYAEATGRPAQFAAFHFYQDVWDSNLVDIMPHPGTSPQTLEVLQAFARRIGQIPLVLKKESPAYVMNALLGAMHKTALKLVWRGVASVEDVDRAVMMVLKMSKV